MLLQASQDGEPLPQKYFVFLALGKNESFTYYCLHWESIWQSYFCRLKMIGLFCLLLTCSLSLVFRSFLMTCRNIVFIPFIFLEVYRASWFYGLISLISFETFSTTTSSSISSVHSFSLSLLVCKEADIWQVITTLSQSVFTLLLFHLFASQIFKINIFLAFLSVC